MPAIAPTLKKGMLWRKTPSFKLDHCVGVVAQISHVIRNSKTLGITGLLIEQNAYAALRIGDRGYGMEIWKAFPGYTHRGCQKHHRGPLSPHNAIDRPVALYNLEEAHQK
ncbi:hypothetical protein A9K65_034010 (plasmid) [Mesorhizobium sp. WSM1497]|nr:hypothetical protein A9K65_034010 [Mesorhizobium sp. WSM1497]